MKRFQLRYILLAVTALGLLVWGAAVTIPNSFTDGDVISASEMNANFTAVETAVNNNESDIATNASDIGTLQTEVAGKVTDGGSNGVQILYGREVIDLATVPGSGTAVARYPVPGMAAIDGDQTIINYSFVDETSPLEPPDYHLSMDFGGRSGYQPELVLSLVSGANLPTTGQVYVEWTALNAAGLATLSTQGTSSGGDASDY